MPPATPPAPPPGQNRLGAADVGRRVVVRSRLPDGRATDVLGELLALDAERLAVRREDGAVVAVALADVVAARPVPPARRGQPVPRAPGRSPRAPGPEAVLELEAAAAAGWPALEAERLGGWLLRASSGFSARGNSALPLGDPGLPLDRAVDAVEAFYATRGLTPRVAVPALLDGALTGPVDGAALDALLAARGWPVQTPTTVMTAPLAVLEPVLEPVPEPVLGPAPALPADLSLDLAADPDPGWLGLHRGQPPSVARAVLSGPPVRAFAAVRAGAGPDRRTVAVARGAVTTAGGRSWMGVTAVEVDPAWRRRGLARALLGALARWAVGHGATDVHLQVVLDNSAARALYAAAGFTDHHRYAYRVAPGPLGGQSPAARSAGEPGGGGAAQTTPVRGA